VASAKIMLRIGLTGGIGSGKSTVSNRFAQFNVPVIDADDIAHLMLEEPSPVTEELQATFGGKVVNSDGQVDRVYLRKLVFNDHAKRKQLEDILHPVIRKEMVQRIVGLTASYCILSIPLLIEADQKDMVDRILVVEAPEHLRIKWIINRSGLTEKEIRKIFSAQTSDTARAAVADDVILNNQNLPHLHRQVDRLHDFYLQLSNQQIHNL